MWFLGLQAGDNVRFAQYWAANAIIDKHKAPAAKRVSVMQTEKCLSVLSDAWQWFYNRTLYNEWNSLGFKLGTTSNLPNLVRNCKYWQAQELELLNGSLLCKLRNAWVSCQMHDNDSITGLFTMYVILWAFNWGQLVICPILGRDSNYWQAQEIQLLKGCLSCRLRNTWVSCQVYDNDSITWLFIMNVIPWASNWGQLPICPILGCNRNYWQAQERQLLNGILPCKLRNAWVSCQMHDNASIAGRFTMNVIPWASSWGQLPICPILGCNRNYWQAQERQLLNGILSRIHREACVSCQMHDNNSSIAGRFTMYVILWASTNWGQATATLPHFGLQSQLWLGQELQLLNGFLSCRQSHSWGLVRCMTMIL